MAHISGLVAAQVKKNVNTFSYLQWWCIKVKICLSHVGVQ